ncbi:MAG: HEAT repeat domain-containing protein [Gemmataceae bacterium]|nr:HEAT repeat domain-containing protein [Gemmataceae bacterium]MDW8263846.1 HEAT repeat domain-containing protein [Gemmataceae bacterium]
MSMRRTILVVVVHAMVVLPAWAGIFFNKKPKTDPAQRVQELIVIVKTDASDKRREEAARELRNFDGKSHPEVTAILIDVLMNDCKANVRAEAAESLGKLRPVTPEAGWALQQAAANDPSLKVRWQARTALIQCQLSGLKMPKVDGPALPATPGGGPPVIVEPGARLAPTPAPGGDPVPPVVVPTSPRSPGSAPATPVVPSSRPSKPLRPVPAPAPTTTEPPLLPSGPAIDQGPVLTPPG